MSRTSPAADREADLLARIAWSSIAEPGDAGVGALVQAFGARGALDRLGSVPELVRERVVNAQFGPLAEQWRARHRPGEAERVLDDAMRSGALPIVPGDEHWPAQLDELDLPPLMLWVRGDTALLGSRSLAVVGARACTSYGEYVTTEIVRHVAASSVAVVSGAAYGVDASAHRAALAVGGSTVAVLAGGVDRPYPAGNRELIGAIAERGLVVSEAPAGAVPTRHRFLMRQRLVAGLSGAVLVAEAGARSGALQAAWHARSQGKPAGAVPGPVTSAASAGTNQMIRDGVATLVASGEQALQLLGEGDEA